MTTNCSRKSPKWSSRTEQKPTKKKPTKNSMSGRFLGVCKPTCKAEQMDHWEKPINEKLLPLLKEVVLTEEGELNCFDSKLNLEESKSQVFDILTELHYCDCCIRHQFNKPCVPHRWVPKPITHNFQITCLCDCRHMARMVCRMCD